jgi:hypothetical protein
MSYAVHLYPRIRVKVSGVKAVTPFAAMQQVEETHLHAGFALQDRGRDSCGCRA